jgi:hypothetical protein
MWHGDPNIGVVMIVTLVFGTMAAVPILIGLLIANNSQKKREAEIMRLAIEKGQPVPSFPVRVSHYGTLKAALIWIAVGVGIVLMVAIESPGDGISLGFIPILIGIALLISWILEKRENERNKLSA